MYSPDGGHKLLYSQKPLYAYDETLDYAEQKARMKEKLMELLGEMPDKVPLNPVIEYTKEYDTYTEYRIAFDVEKDVQAVCLLCIPKQGKDKYPLAICLQGHSTGMHNSMNYRIYPNDNAAAGDRDYARQSVERGYAALSLEQRGMGVRRTSLEEIEEGNGSPLCHITTMNALMHGRTMIGERCWDVSRAIDLALTFPQVDGSKILCTGNSGGGTTTFYAACYDERITVAMPSCAVCTFKDSIGAMKHCVCNFIPGIAKYMDMGDMALMIAPRKLVVVNGKYDPIFPEHGVKEAFATIQKIYAAAGVPGNCALATGDGEHRYYAAQAWGALDEVAKW